MTARSDKKAESVKAMSEHIGVSVEHFSYAIAELTNAVGWEAANYRAAIRLQAHCR